LEQEFFRGESKHLQGYENEAAVSSKTSRFPFSRNVVLPMHGNEQWAADKSPVFCEKIPRKNRLRKTGQNSSTQAKMEKS
jgi:hypothetical protein